MNEINSRKNDGYGNGAIFRFPSHIFIAVRRYKSYPKLPVKNSVKVTVERTVNTDTNKAKHINTRLRPNYLAVVAKT